MVSCGSSSSKSEQTISCNSTTTNHGCRPRLIFRLPATAHGHRLGRWHGLAERSRPGRSSWFPGGQRQQHGRGPLCIAYEPPESGDGDESVQFVEINLMNDRLGLGTFRLSFSFPSTRFLVDWLQTLACLALGCHQVQLF